jgi:DNA ligase 1
LKTLPTLYKLTSTGAIQTWSIGVEENIIVTHFGQQGGKIQRTEEVIKDGKNIGRSNETSPAEQALSEATSKWEGKIKKGYVEEVSRAISGEKDIDGGYDCMLAHKFRDHGHKIVYPAYVQPKLNGHRCLAVIEDGKATLWSRTRKPITSCPHIVTELETMFPSGRHELDGELYNHDFKDRFEDLASLIRQEVPKKPECYNVQYHVYDKNISGPFKDRTKALAGNFLGHDYIKFTHTELVNNEEELIAAFDLFLSKGYEGAMARNSTGPYVGKRSYDLQKIKEFLDEDYPIIGINEGTGTFAGCGVFVCQTPEGVTFDVAMNGPKSRLREFLNDPSLWKGKILNVQYQYISKYGKPIFPRGIRFSDK